MMRMRFPSAWVSGACLTSALLVAPVVGGPVAHAQFAPVPATPAQPAVQARINDIQVGRDGETISILIKLSQQPAAAAAKASGEALIVEIDGVTLIPLTLAPPAGSLVTKVETTSGKLTFSGTAFATATTVIYRNAVLIEARLAEPSLHAGASLMTAGASAKPPPAIAPAPAAPVVAPEKPPQPADTLQSHPAPAVPSPSPPPPPQKATSIAAIAGIDVARCTTSAAELAKDAWALSAMGDYALCLLDAGKLDEAKSRIDQLAAITPQDWRVALGRAVLEEKSGDPTKAQAAFLSASLAAPNDTIRATIAARILTAPKEADDIQLPLPSASTKH